MLRNSDLSRSEMSIVVMRASIATELLRAFDFFMILYIEYVIFINDILFYDIILSLIIDNHNISHS